MIQNETYDSTPWCQTTAIMLSFPGGSVVKNLPANARATGDMGSSLGWEDPLKEEMSTHSSILAWRIPFSEKPGGLQPARSQRRSDVTEQLTFSLS